MILFLRMGSVFEALLAFLVRSSLPEEFWVSRGCHAKVIEMTDLFGVLSIDH